MAERSRIYLETTIVSYLAARPSRDLRVAAHQQISWEWWKTRRTGFELFASQLVIDEASAGDEEASTRRLQFLDGVTLLVIDEAGLALAVELLEGGAVPRGSEEDALHIAVAAVHGMDYLMTWNCRHIANAAIRNSIAAICAVAGLAPPVICTPEELLEVG